MDSSQSVNSPVVKLLSPSSFEKTRHSEGENFLTYTGKLTELSVEYLESTEPKWKKLSDRLERGEKFTILVILGLRDDHFKKIKLSDNREERSRQFAQIQDKFLKKIPSDLILKDVEKYQNHPYIAMEVNLDLLTYLIDEQVKLRVKNISELTKLP